MPDMCECVNVPSTRLASTAGSVEGKRVDDWVEALSGRLNVLACMKMHQPAGPAPHEAFHWLAWAISGS